MKPVLSILDPSPIFEGRTALDALNETRALAIAADAMSFRSFWVQEHHNSSSFAGTTPEILMADLASRTDRIAFGSGGIMLPNYSPLKVAEWGQSLNQLYPGRIEIGLGRATGADPRTSAALLGPGGQNFPAMLRMLMDWFLDASGEKPLSKDMRAHGIAANPAGPRPDLWVLCSSPGSAAFAGSMGVKLAFADFLNPGGAAAALEAYRDAFQPSQFADEPYCAIGLGALAADTEEEAAHLAGSVAAWSLSRGAGFFCPFQSAQKAAEKIERSPIIPPQRSIVGTGKKVAQTLHDKAAEAGANELFILSIAETTEARIKSYALIDEAWAALA